MAGDTTTRDKPRAARRQQPARWERVGMRVELIPNEPMEHRDDLMPGRNIIVADPAGWSGVALMEWSLAAEEWVERR